ncbi:MAG: sensory rhodopsin transducer [Kofleriaceae bacterium]
MHVRYPTDARRATRGGRTPTRRAGARRAATRPRQADDAAAPGAARGVQPIAAAPAAPACNRYASIIESDRPIVVQHTRLDSRQAENALITTSAFPVH